MNSELQNIVLERLDPLVKKLKSMGSFTYMKNTGNWGDSLIDYGNKRLFKELGLNYKEMPPNTKEPIDGPFVLGGGGSFCKYWHSTALKANKFAALGNEVIILPSTYAYDCNLPNNVTLFSRDDVYHDFSVKKNVHPEIVPDLALFADKENVCCNLGKLYAYRTNIDRHPDRPEELPLNNFDFSSFVSEKFEPKLFLRIVGSYNEIESDRLHIILGAVIQQVDNIIIRPNGYRKNESHFLCHKDILTNVKFLNW